MIPIFPTFRILEIEDKKDIENFTKNFPPYSDYNFTSLWTWNVQGQTEISLLNNNLTIKFQDYITNEIAYSFLGINSVDETIIDLIKYSESTDNVPALQLIPESVVLNIKRPNEFVITEDIDNFDYILSVSELINLTGKELRGKKNLVNRFERMYGSDTKASVLDLTNENIKKEILQLFYTWEKSSKKERADTENELKAIQRLLRYSDELQIYIIGLFVDNQLTAFSINEVINKEYGVIHYEKADISFTGVFQYLKQQSAINFQQQGCTFINYEQDLGIEGLRKAKMSYKPIKFLKKYIVASKIEAISKI